jgi:hypothetical protein
MKINVSLAPKDGYWFRDTDGTVLRGNSWSGLNARVVAYRKRNGLPQGNPAEEVTAQVCERTPSYCRENEDPVYMAAVKIASLKGRVLKWLAGVRHRHGLVGLPYVDEALMRARADVCSRCPSHATISGGCGSCKKLLKASREEVLEGRPIADVQGCVSLDLDCAVEAWINDPADGPDSLPGCCWKRKNAP